jgi:biofilm protein TabA
MKILSVRIMVLAGLLSFLGCKSTNDPSSWSDGRINRWFEKGDWLNGWKVAPDASVNRKALAVSYFKNKARWDKAFAFLKDNDLPKLETRRYDIDGDNLYATVSEYITNNEEGAKYEAHRKYIDIQYVVSGKEKIGLAPLEQKKEVVTPYDSEKDFELMVFTSGQDLKATPGRFYIFFPSDAHSPGLRDGDNSLVRKVVVKVKVD